MLESISHLLLQYPWMGLVVNRSFRVIVIITVVVVCAKLIRLGCTHILDAAKKAHEGDRRALERDKRLTTVVNMVATMLRIGLFGSAGLMVLQEFGLDIRPFLTGAGIAGLAFGFGAQTLVKDMISGFFFLIEDQIRVGDVIRLNNSLSGTVERMHLRVTAIRDGDGTLHIVPNGEIKSISNMTYEYATSVASIPVSYATDVERLKSALSEVADSLDNDPQWKQHLRSKPMFDGIVKFESGHMMVELSVKTEPHSRWKVARELRTRSKIALDKAGISMPSGSTVSLQLPTQ